MFKLISMQGWFIMFNFDIDKLFGRSRAQLWVKNHLLRKIFGYTSLKSIRLPAIKAITFNIYIKSIIEQPKFEKSKQISKILTQKCDDFQFGKITNGL